MEKGMLDQKKPKVALYDLQKDPLEKYNVVDDPTYQEIYQMMMQKLNTWQLTYQDMELPLPKTQDVYKRQTVGNY